MHTARLVLTVILLLFATYLVVMNWGCMLISIRNFRRGIDRHYSMVPLVTVIASALAYFISPQPHKTWMFTIPAFDIANWNLLRLPLFLLSKPKDAFRSVPNDSDFIDESSR